MSRTYKATGINLKSMPMGESDRLLTILTREFGLVRAIAMGSRKHNSRLGGRSELFVVNELMIAKGRSLDKITQAETLESYPRLGQDLKKLIASQYLAELCLHQALSDQPQEDLFCLLNEHLARLERSPASQVLAHLTHAIFQLLVLAGVAPQVHLCCVTRQLLPPDLTDRDWRVGFSIPAGGTVTLVALERLRAEKPSLRQQRVSEARPTSVLHANVTATETSATENRQTSLVQSPRTSIAGLHRRLSAPELMLLQHLADAELPAPEALLACMQPGGGSQGALDRLWQSVEQALRSYAQYYFDRPIRSATLIDACFATAEPV
ncbi:MAG: DNA repair protein RecO [Tildeniella nuda ZEHNDER 1965/U140]|jgi:DNA repair protein RecO (recombination protein O)|nr:DNA repair protein RecO [Tildeniella nuda ZEHNDER 1965/U140]